MAAGVGCIFMAFLASRAVGVDVIVVGAGVSGLTAARSLVDQWSAHCGQLNVRILEAESRIGGRTFTDKTVAWAATIVGAEVDKGASWIHGSSSTHPITKIRDALSLNVFTTNYDIVTTMQCTGTVAHSNCSSLSDTRWSEYVQMRDSAKLSTGQDVSMWDRMLASGKRNDPVMQYHMASATEFSYGGSLKNLSAKYFATDLAFSGVEQVFQGGYDKVVQALHAGTIKLDALPAITSSSSGNRTLTVETAKVNRVEENAGKLKVSTVGGTMYQVDHVIMTVPLGVLKRNDITFSPPLPAAQQTAISRVGFGNVLKVCILFDATFWDVSRHYFGLVVLPGLENAEKFTYFLNMQPVVSQPVLMTFAFGESATEVEGWSDQQVWTLIRSNLIAFFGPQASAATKRSMWRSNWASNPNFRGAYSYSAVGQVPSDWTALATAHMSNRLHFAGEHTNKNYRGTVHGAFYSGTRSASEVFATYGCMTTTTLLGAMQTSGGNRVCFNTWIRCIFLVAWFCRSCSLHGVTSD